MLHKVFIYHKMRKQKHKTRERMAALKLNFMKQLFYAGCGHFIQARPFILIFMNQPILLDTVLCRVNSTVVEKCAV